MKNRKNIFSFVMALGALAAALGGSLITTPLAQAAAGPSKVVMDIERLRDQSREMRDVCDTFKKNLMKAEKSKRPLGVKAFEDTLGHLKNYPGIPASSSEALAIFQNSDLSSLPVPDQERALRAISDLEYCEAMILFQGFRDLYDAIPTSHFSKQNLNNLKKVTISVIQKDAAKIGPLILTTVHIDLLKKLGDTGLISKSQDTKVQALAKEVEQLKSEIQNMPQRKQGAAAYTLGISELTLELKGADQIRKKVLALVQKL